MGKPFYLSVSGKNISGTPSMSGISNVTLTATDGGGLSTSTSFSFSFTVLPASTRPPTAIPSRSPSLKTGYWRISNSISPTCIYLRHTWEPAIVRGYIENPTPNHTAYVYTYVYSPKPQTLGAWVGFHTYGRSEKDASTPTGQWGYKSSKLWMNEQEIQLPFWKTPGQHPADNEVIYTNEPYENRPPLPIPLKKGWNKVLVKVPVGSFQTADSRLVKWMFSFVFVKSNGLNYDVAD